MKWWDKDRLDRAQAVVDAQVSDFAELFAIGGLDKKVHLRNTDLSRMIFSGCDLRGFDFTGARLHDCNFRDALIKGARFDQAEINRANLRAAKDWNANLHNWRRKVQPSNDAYLPNGAVFQDAPFGPELIVIPPGLFLMGSPEDEEDRHDDEGPQHEVTIPHRLAVGRYPVTFEEWDFAISEGGTGGYRPYDQGWGRGHRPVINVSLKDAQLYLAWLRRRTGYAYRLLTEAEWEYCCRAGSATRFPFGESGKQRRKYAWLYDMDSGNNTHPVGEKLPNTWGLHDMLGNVDEWVEDPWHENYAAKPEKLKKTGKAWKSGGGDLQVVRGGVSGIGYDYLRPVFRIGYAPGDRSFHCGFRIARTLTA